MNEDLVGVCNLSKDQKSALALKEKQSSMLPADTDRPKPQKQGATGGYFLGSTTALL